MTKDLIHLKRCELCSLIFRGELLVPMRGNLAQDYSQCETDERPDDEARGRISLPANLFSCDCR